MNETRTKADDYGEILYEKSNAKTMYDTPTGINSAKGWVMRIYMILLCVALLAWFIYSVVNMASQEDANIVSVLVNHVMAFFVLAVAELILLLSAFGGWGKFLRTSLRHGLTRQRGIEGAQVRQLQEELATADANKSMEDAVRIYKDCVVVVNIGVEKIINYSDLQRVKCDPQPKGYRLTFLLYDNTEIVADQLIPLSDLPLVKKHFDNFDYAPARRQKGYWKDKISVLAIALVPILVGIGAIILHYLVFNDMPLVFGIFFIAVGIIVALGQFGDIPVIQNGVLPILFGSLFTALPILIALTLTDFIETLTVAAILNTFTPVHAILSVFLGLGPMMIIIGVAGIIDSLRALQ